MRCSRRLFFTHEPMLNNLLAWLEKTNIVEAICAFTHPFVRQNWDTSTTVPESEPVAPPQPETPQTPSPTPIAPPQPVYEPTEAPKATIAAFCAAIAAYEGGPGDANHRNCNPGNVRYNPSGYLPIYGTVRRSPAGFAIFRDWDTGMLYLRNMLKGQIHAHPNETILQFMQRYAPSSENDPLKYAQFIAKRLSTDTSFQMKNLV